MMRTYAARFGLFALGRKSRAAQEPCSMGIGCDEAGVCYAGAMGQPEECPRALAAAARQGGDVKQAPAESPQSGPKGNAQ
jgi:hypothetical protein